VNPSAARAHGPGEADLLRGAFQAWPATAGWQWQALVYPVPPNARARCDGEPTVVRVDLTAPDALALAALIDHASQNLSPAPGAPFSPWLGVAEAAAFADVQPATLRGWLARGGPKKHPFPQPDWRIRGRSYWLERTLRAWKPGYFPRPQRKQATGQPLRSPAASAPDSPVGIRDGLGGIADLAGPVGGEVPSPDLTGREQAAEEPNRDEL
jgi:hypothetical protein